MSSTSVSAASISPERDSDSDSDSDSHHPTHHDQYKTKPSPRHVRGENRDRTTSRDILLFLIAFRILNALSIKTFFQPDEYFQSLEPAWEWAFGADSGAWITWEWKNQLRSAIHPAIFAGVYWLSSCLSRGIGLAPDAHADLLIAAPKVTQAVFAALGDYYTWKLGERVYGRGSNEGWATLAMTVCSPWQWFCSTRTLSNCLETTLTIIALHLWPWEWSLDENEEDSDDEDHLQSTSSSTTFTRDLQRLRGSLLLAAVACVLRPTNILIWICITYFALFGSAVIVTTTTPRHGAPFRWTDLMVWSSVPSLDLLSSTQRKRKILVWEIVRNGSAILVLSILIDRLYYQQWTFPPLRFLYFNLARSVAVFYGRNDWHYYLTQGFPLLLTTLLVFALLGIYQGLFLSTTTTEALPSRVSTAILHQLSTTTVFLPLALSLISHKEVRFIYPLLPALHIISARPLTKFFLPSILHPPPSPKRLLLLALLLANLALAFFATTSHQAAPLTALTYLRTQHTTHYLLSQPPPNTLPPAPTTMTVGFLTPCHSTPWRSHLVHPGIKAWALTCDPPLHLNASARATYTDEADRFYANPTTFLFTHLGSPPSSPHKKPSFFSFFGRSSSSSSSSSPPEHHPSSSSSTTPDQSPSQSRSSAQQQQQQQREEAWNGNPGPKHWPEYLVFFAQLEDAMRRVLAGSRYGECWRGWNSWGHEDWRRRGDMVVWCLR